MLKLKKILLILTITLVFTGMMFLIPGVLYAAPSVSPASATIEVGATQQFTASGFPVGGSGINWQSLPITGIATIDSSGLATGVSPGTVTIRAYKTVGASTHEAFASLTVIPAGPPPTLVSIDVTPVNPSINIGATQQFTATGNYSSGPTQDITNSVAWSSSDTLIATIVVNSGLATGVSDGSVTITATLDTISGNTGLTVNPAVNPTGQIVWDGNKGTDSLRCDLLDTSSERTESGWIHWIITQGSDVTDAELVLGGSGSGTYGINAQHGGSIHFFTPYFDVTSLTAVMNYSGTLGDNPQFNISDYCPGTGTTETGCIEVIKTTDDKVAPGTPFVFSISLGGQTITITTDGTYSGSGKFCDLTIGQEYTITETTTGYTTTVSLDGTDYSSGTSGAVPVPVEGDGKIWFHNDPGTPPPPPPPSPGSIIINKIFIDGKISSGTFEFAIYDAEADGNLVTTASITITDSSSGSTQVTGLTINQTYWVEETSGPGTNIVPGPGVRLSVVAAENPTADNTVTFVNDPGTPPPKVKVLGIEKAVVEEEVEVLGIEEEVIEELPYTGFNFIFSLAGILLIMAGGILAATIFLPRKKGEIS